MDPDPPWEYEFGSTKLLNTDPIRIQYGSTTLGRGIIKKQVIEIKYKKILK